MKANPYASKTKEELARLYVEKIGYDPFQDDPAMTAARVAGILASYDEETRDFRTSEEASRPAFPSLYRS